jgi:hypothetical protein
VKIADEVLAELRQGRSLKEIRTKFRSSSQIYEGLRIFLEQSEKTVEEAGAPLSKQISHILHSFALQLFYSLWKKPQSR